MTTPAPPRFADHRFPAEIIGYAIRLYFRFPLSLRYVDEILLTRGIVVSHQTVRQRGLKLSQLRCGANWSSDLGTGVQTRHSGGPFKRC